MRFAVIGCGFWSRYQIAAWHELCGVHLAAVYNRTRSKAECIAHLFHVSSVYDSIDDLFRNERLDFVDIITDVGTHEHFVLTAAQYGVPVICQKPMAPDLETAKRMVMVCKQAGIFFAVHENWRWQKPIRELKGILESGVIGKPFRARASFNKIFSVFDNQPLLAELDHFIITDIGVHLLDTMRYLFGEAKSLYCQTAKIHADIKGEDVASIALKMRSGMHCNVELSYASRFENDCYPETFLVIEGEKGSIELGPHCRLKTTTEKGTSCEEVILPHYEWVDERYKVVQTSIVSANEDLLRAMEQGRKAETSGEDNLRTLQLAFAAYESARCNTVIEFPNPSALKNLLSDEL